MLIGTQKIYLAARYTRREELCRYRDDLEARGCVVTSRWLNGEHQILDAEMMSMRGEEIAAKRMMFATDDLNDLLDSDICISFTEAPRSEHSRGGRHVEFGIALASGLRVIVVGHRENLFHCLPGVALFETWAEALAWIARQ